MRKNTTQQSVWRLADGDGQITLARGYTPYGEPLWAQGTASSRYGFTGEDYDPSVGLVFLRARYMQPRLGMFTSRDPWGGDQLRPGSMNGWNYGEQDPINRVDPMGHFASEYCSPSEIPGICVLCGLLKRADLTRWLVDEMNTNQKGQIAAAIRQNILQEMMSITTRGVYLANAGLLFEDVVHDHGLWDFKYKIEDIVGFNVKLGDVWYNADVPGNIHFGYLGVAVGFPTPILHCGADYATDKTLCSGSDHLDDYEAIEAGADVWRFSAGGDVTLASLKTALAAHPNMRLGEPTIPNFMSLAFEWPYAVGTFDGSRSQQYR